MKLTSVNLLAITCQYCSMEWTKPNLVVFTFPFKKKKKFCCVKMDQLNFAMLVSWLQGKLKNNSSLAW